MSYRGYIAPVTQRILALRAQGMPLHRIAREVERTKGSVSNTLCRYGRTKKITRIDPNWDGGAR